MSFYLMYDNQSLMSGFFICVWCFFLFLDAFPRPLFLFFSRCFSRVFSTRLFNYRVSEYNSVLVYVTVFFSTHSLINAVVFLVDRIVTAVKVKIRGVFDVYSTVWNFEITVLLGLICIARFEDVLIFYLKKE